MSTGAPTVAGGELFNECSVINFGASRNVVVMSEGVADVRWVSVPQ
jgi:hypothetical protein